MHLRYRLENWCLAVKKSLKEIFDLALTTVRPLFATVPGMRSAYPSALIKESL